MHGHAATPEPPETTDKPDVGTYLFVADAGGGGKSGYVGIYDDNATQQGQIAVRQPVHLMYDTSHGWLFIGDEGTGSVLIYNPAEKSGPATLISSQDPPKIDHTAGLALDSAEGAVGTLYVASRVAQEVLQFPLDFSSGTPALSGAGSVALGSLDDEPEFVQPDRTSRRIGGAAHGPATGSAERPAGKPAAPPGVAMRSRSESSSASFPGLSPSRRAATAPGRRCPVDNLDAPQAQEGTPPSAR